MPKEWSDIAQYCSKISLVWAVGSSQVQDFPEDLAYPIDTDYKYFILNIHYDNPQRLPSLLKI